MIYWRTAAQIDWRLWNELVLPFKIRDIGREAATLPDGGIPLCLQLTQLWFGSDPRFVTIDVNLDRQEQDEFATALGQVVLVLSRNKPFPPLPNTFILFRTESFVRCHQITVAIAAPMPRLPNLALTFPNRPSFDGSRWVHLRVRLRASRFRFASCVIRRVNRGLMDANRYLWPQRGGDRCGVLQWSLECLCRFNKRLVFCAMPDLKDRHGDDGIVVPERRRRNREPTHPDLGY